MMRPQKWIRPRIELVTIVCFLAFSPASAEIRPLAPVSLVTAAEELFGNGIKIAPDNAKIFFVAQEDEPFYLTTTRLYEVPIAGGPITTRTIEANGFGGAVNGYAFTPDGRHLIFKDWTTDCLCFNGDAYVMPIADGAPLQLTFEHSVAADPLWRPTFSADGSRMVYLGVNPDRRLDLLSVPLDGSASTTRLSNPVPYPGEVRSDWKLRPDSDEVLYVAPRAGDNGYNLFRVNAMGGAPQRVNLADELLSKDRWTKNSFAINSTGNDVAYGVYAGPAGRPTVMSRQLSGGPEIELTPAFAEHDNIQIDIHGFVQDSVVFEADFENAYQYELYVATVDGGTVKKLSAASDYVADSAVVSPNGAAVLFTANAGSVWPPYPEHEVFLYDVAAESVRSLGVYPSSSNLPSFHFNAAGDHFVMPGGGGKPPKLLTAEGDFVRTFDEGFFQFHPDGEHYFYLANVAGTPSYWSELFMARLDGVGDAVHISHDPIGGPGIEEFTFSNDGMLVVYSRREFGQPLQIFAVQFVPEPGSAVIAALAVAFISGTRGKKPRAKVGR